MDELKNSTAEARNMIPILAIILAFLVGGCAKHVTVRPPVSSALGHRVFKAMGEIHRYPVHVGLFIDPKLEAETIRVTRELGTAEIAFRQVISAKVIQALSYKFERITFVTDPAHSPRLMLSLAMEGENPSVGVDINQYPNLMTQAGTFDVVAKVDARMRITLSDNGQQIWVGHARVVGEEVSGGAAYGVMEGSSQAVDITNRITDELVADLLTQMQRSTELKRFLEEKRT